MEQSKPQNKDLARINEDNLFETVHTMTDYYDGPRTGIADYLGHPYCYESCFSNLEDDYTDEFILQPIGKEMFCLAMENWSIWQRWESAFRKGQTTLETHPALPEDRKRRLEIDIALENGPTPVGPGIRVTAEFQYLSRPDERVLRPPTHVRWSRADLVSTEED